MYCSGFFYLTAKLSIMVSGIVIKSTGVWYDVRLEDGQILPCRIVGKFRIGKLKLTNPVAVGDEVFVNIIEEETKVGNIVKIAHRRNYVVRQSPRKKHLLHLLSANIDQAILVVTIKDPSLKQGFIDRFLLMTEPQDISVTIIVNKSDLLIEDDYQLFEYIKAVYENIGYPTLLTSAMDNKGIEEVRTLLKDKTTMVCGQSGVGKSTLVNAIDADIETRIGDISDYTGKGQHTTTFAEMFPLNFGGQLIDTPGIKSLSFNNLEPMDVAHNFREFFILSADCKFSDCTHREEPKCAVKEALEEGSISEYRYRSYLNILNGIEDQNYWERHKDM